MKTASRKRGAISVQLLVILVPVIFALMGFALDLGRLYLVRGELRTASNAMAISAAQRLIGTDVSLANASLAAQTALDTTTNGTGNRYDFGALPIGQTTGILSSSAADPAFFDSLASAIPAGDSAGGSQAAGGSTAKYVKINLTADAPLLFWAFLKVGQDRKTSIAAQSVAGISAPLCTACDIEPLAVAAVDANDATDFGFLVNTRYSFGYQCTGGATPANLAGTLVRIPFLILNRLDQNATLFPDENSQLYRYGAQGLAPNTLPAQACISVNAQEQIWVNAAPVACTAPVPTTVSNMMCGIASRFDPTVSGICANIPEVDTMSSIYTADSDITDLDDYTAYTGSTRRVITVPIVDALSATGTMTVLGFRQFLVEPNPNDVTIAPADSDARFVALYIGSPVPLKQGRFDSCGITAGPGKVVLHQ